MGRIRMCAGRKAWMPGTRFGQDRYRKPSTDVTFTQCARSRNQNRLFGKWEAKANNIITAILSSPHYIAYYNCINSRTHSTAHLLHSVAFPLSLLCGSFVGRIQIIVGHCGSCWREENIKKEEVVLLHFVAVCLRTHNKERHTTGLDICCVPSPQQAISSVFCVRIQQWWCMPFVVPLLAFRMQARALCNLWARTSCVSVNPRFVTSRTRATRPLSIFRSRRFRRFNKQIRIIAFFTNFMNGCWKTR